MDGLAQRNRGDVGPDAHRFPGTITTDVILARLRNERQRRLTSVGHWTHIVLAVATVALAAAAVAQRYRGFRADTLLVGAAVVAAGWALIVSRWVVRRALSGRTRQS